ncbi:MAG TPA: DUF2779 domain-containing protein [Gemmatimonadales bacterium]|jgi:hypothetical protein
MRTLSKSDFKLASNCATKLHYKERGYPQREDDNPYLAMLAEGGYMVEQLARLRFPEAITLSYGRDPVLDAAETRQALHADQVTLFEATILSGRKLVRIDVLRKNGNRVDLIEVKSKSFDPLAGGAAGPFRNSKKRGNEYPINSEWIEYIDDVTYQTMVLREACPEFIVTPWLLVVDKTGETSVEALPQLFEIRRDVEIDGRIKDLDIRYTGASDNPAAQEILTQVNVSSEVEQRLPEVAAIAEELLALYHDDVVDRAPPDLRYVTCRDCEFRVAEGVEQNGFAECWGALGAVKPSILELYKFSTTKLGDESLADVMIRAGKVSLYDVNEADLVKKSGEPTAASVRQLRQIACTRDDEVWISPRMAEALGSWQYPLHFIDFETSMMALPYHAGMRPFETIGFQWSCHSIDVPGGEVRHAEWLNDRDSWPCLEFVESLREAIGDDGTVLMWATHERTTLNKIADQMERYGVGTPELRAWMERLVGTKDEPGRLRDMNRLCEQYFVLPGTGRTSIKVILDGLWQRDAVMRERFREWFGGDAYEVAAGKGPYEALPELTIAGTTLDVSEGTGAMRAYQAMLYGAERRDPALVEGYRMLLKRYCKLDTLAMVLVWDSWRRRGEG